MKDNEQDFLSRYDFEAGEREFRTPGHKIKALGRYIIVAPARIKRMAAKIKRLTAKLYHTKAGAYVFPAAIVVLLAIAFAFWASGMREHIEGLKRLSAAESVYDLQIVHHEDHFNDHGLLPVTLSRSKTGDVLNCQLPAADYMNHKVPISCDGNVTLTAK